MADDAAGAPGLRRVDVGSQSALDGAYALEARVVHSVEFAVP